jgi:cytochrome P450
MTMTGQAAIEFDPYSHKVHDDPYPYYQRLRDEAPVYLSPRGFWVLSRWDDVQRAMRDFKNFSNSLGVSLEAEMNHGYPMIIAMDPPTHTRQRKIIATMLTPEKVLKLEALIRELAVELLEPHLDKGKIDMLQDFAVYLPMAVIARMIKVPRADEDKVRNWTDLLVQREDGEAKISKTVAEAYINLAVYFDNLIKAHWDDAPDDTLISAIIQAEKSGDLTHDDVIGFMILLGVAGNETTTKLIGNMSYRLWQNKDQRQILIDNPSLIANGMEETMRFDGSSQLLGRTLLNDIEFNGFQMKKGQRVAMLLISANRDERKWENPDKYDVTRKTAGHMGFGLGIHSCVGAALARLEGRVAFEEILKAMPDFEIDPTGLDRMYSPNVRGFTHVPMTFTPRRKLV